MTVPDSILRSSQLPSLPAVAVRLLQLARDPETDVRTVIETIRSDPAICAKILKAANSSYFGFRSKVTSIERAVPLLGTTVVTSLALGFSLVDDSAAAGPMYEFYQRYWLQSLAQAAASELLSQHAAAAVECEYFLAGLLADLGHLALLKTMAKQYAPLLQTAQDGLHCLLELERQALGCDHVEVGVVLMEKWELPDPLVRAAALHHASLEELQQQADDPHFELVRAVAVGTAFGEYFCGYGKGRALQRAKLLTKELYGFSEEQLHQFIEQTSTRIDEAGELFSLNTSQIPSPAELLAQANEQLAQLAMRAQLEREQAKQRERWLEREKEQLALKNRELLQQAVHDPLTGVYNRGFFEETLRREIAQAQRAGTTVGLLFLDVDHFKRINDTYGHRCGDSVLQRVAHLVSRSVRSADIVARYGGEEFTVVVHQPTESGIRALAERVRRTVEEASFEFDGQSFPVTVSVGGAIALPGREERDLAERLVEAADRAMYEAKQNGRNQVRIRSLIEEPERVLLQRVTQARFSRWLVDRGIFDVPTVSKLLPHCQGRPERIGELAQRFGYLSRSEVEQVLERQRQTGERFGTAAVRLGLLEEAELVYLLACQKEDPGALKRTLVQAGLLDDRHAEALLREYLAETVPRRTVGVVPSVQ